MSLILEALQRADQERRDGGDVPGIDAQHSSDEPTPVRPPRSETISSRIYVPLLLGLVVALGIYVIYLQGPGLNAATEHSARAEPQQPTPRVENRGGMTAPIPAPNTGPRPALNSSQNSSLSPEQAQNPDRLSPTEIAALYQRAEQQQAELIDYAQADIVQETEQQALPSNKTEAIDSSAAANTFDNEADAVYLRLPFASQLESHQQRSIPALRYTTHGYDEQTGTGRVTLNGRAYRRGDSIAGGLLLVDVRADYIVLDMDGTLFRLHAASDWTP